MKYFIERQIKTQSHTLKLWGTYVPHKCIILGIENCEMPSKLFSIRIQKCNNALVRAVKNATSYVSKNDVNIYMKSETIDMLQDFIVRWPEKITIRDGIFVTVDIKCVRDEFVFDGPNVFYRSIFVNERVHIPRQTLM